MLHIRSDTFVCVCLLSFCQLCIGRVCFFYLCWSVLQIFPISLSFRSSIYFELSLMKPVFKKKLCRFCFSCHKSPLCSLDPPDQLRLNCPRAERQQSLRLLLPCGATRLLPGSGHDGHCHSDGVELRVHAGLRGKLRGEWSGGVHPDFQRNG